MSQKEESTPKVSIIVPVYNAERFLPECLESLIGQTLREIEIICVNDGSKDHSLEILKRYAADDARIRIIDKVNEGVSIARNVGLDVAAGEYIMFVDSDDWLDLNTCRETYETTIRHGADCVMFSYTKVFRDHQAENHLFDAPELILDGDVFKENFYRRLVGPIGTELSAPQNLDLLVSPCMQLFKRELIGDKRFFDARRIGTAEDLLFQLDVYRHCNRFVYIDKPYYFYRRSENGTLTTVYLSDKSQKWLELFRLIAEKAGTAGNPGYQEALSNRIALSCLGLGLNEIRATDGLFAKAHRYKTVLNSSPYREAVSRLDITPMPIHWKLFYLLCKKRLTVPAVAMLECIEFLRTHKR